MINLAVIDGRVATDVEIKQVSKGDKTYDLARFSLAHNKSNKVTEFYDIVCWGNMAHVANNFINKGMLVVVEGSLSKETVTRDGGGKVSYVKIQAAHITFMSKQKKEDTEITDTDTDPSDDETDNETDLPDSESEEDMPF